MAIVLGLKDGQNHRCPCRQCRSLISLMPLHAVLQTALKASLHTTEMPEAFQSCRCLHLHFWRLAVYGKRIRTELQTRANL